jgi:hypothetical protein
VLATETAGEIDHTEKDKQYEQEQRGRASTNHQTSVVAVLRGEGKEEARLEQERCADMYVQLSTESNLKKQRFRFMRRNGK